MDILLVCFFFWLRILNLFGCGAFVGGESGVAYPVARWLIFRRTAPSMCHWRRPAKVSLNVNYFSGLLKRCVIDCC